MLSLLSRQLASKLSNHVLCALQSQPGTITEAVRCVSTTTALWRWANVMLPVTRPPNAPKSGVQPDLVEKVLGPEVASAPELRRLRQVILQQEFGMFPGDTGSTEVQVAILTDRIHDMAVHMKNNHKDYSAKRGLEAMLQKRKRLLMYLRRKNYDRFSILITRLGLKDNHMRMTKHMVRAIQNKGQRVNKQRALKERKLKMAAARKRKRGN